MNYPSRAEGNWTWRVTDEQLTPHLAERLAELTALYGR
jgi:4-alpha-glucanotransferase